MLKMPELGWPINRSNTPHAMKCAPVRSGKAARGLSMLWLLRYTLWLFAKGLFSLRYRVSLRGLDKLPKLKGGPVLVVPNHPAYIEPAIVLTTLWRPLNPRPLLFASMFSNPVLYPIMKILDPLEL